MTPFREPIYITRPLLPPLDRVMARLQEVWASQWLTNNGILHGRLEQALREYLQTPHLALFNNGTTALLTALKALDLQGEVITTPFTFPATPHVLAWSGMTPVFADVDPVRLTLDPERVEEAITPRTTAILGVHVFGLPCDVDGLQRIADRHGLKLVYDAAHAFGTTVRGVSVGSFGDLTMFSFHATKLFHTAEGGALVCRTSDTRARVDLLKNFGIVDPETVSCVGINGKMNELQAAIGLCVLECLEEEVAARSRLVDLYRRLLGPVSGVALVPEIPGVGSNHQYCAIRVDERLFGRSRDAVHQELQKYNVITRKYFYPLCSDYPSYRDLPSANPQRLPVARDAAEQVLCLPLYGTLEPAAVESICEIVATLQGCAA